jgi:hypothetical protein
MDFLGLFLIILALVLIYYVFKYLFSDPNTLNKMTGGQIETVVAKNDLANSASVNFTYSIWFYVNDWNTRFGEEKVIFGRYDKTKTSMDAASPFPAMTLGSSTNDLTFYLQCEGFTTPSKCVINNVPIQKWVSVVASVYGRTVDLYLDGKLVKTCLLDAVPDPNDFDVLITPNGGFDGWTSNFQYYPDALGPQDVYNIYTNGYGGNFMSNFLKSFSVQVSLLQNGVQYSSFSF